MTDADQSREEGGGEFEGGPTGDADREPGSSGDPEFEEAVSQLEEVESKRRRLFVGAGLLALVAVGGAIILAAEYQEFLFRPEMNKEESIRSVVRKTDDPECREFIHRVTQLAQRFYSLEPELEEHLPGDDLEAIRNLDRKLVTLKKDLEAAGELADEANLRFDHSSKEIDDWMGVVIYEIEILRDVAGNQLPGSRGRDAGGPDAGAADALDAGDVAGAGVGDAGDVGDDGVDMPPAERRRKALKVVHQSFDEFRVWHSGANRQHPCGSAEEGESPWRPDGWSAGDAGWDAL